MKQKTVKQKRNKWRAIEWSCFIGEFLSIAAPFITIAIVNYNKYFVEYSGTKMSVSFTMALIVMGIAIFLVSKKKFENSFITLVLGWAVVAFIFTMMGEMITDLGTIMWFGLIGLLGAYGLDIASKAARKKKDFINEAMRQAEKEDLVEETKAEKIEKQENKVKF